MDETIKCEGCGVVLQTDNPGEPGYVPASLFEKYEKPLCQRCFRIRHYGSNTPITGKYYSLEQVKRVLADCGHSFYVADLVNLTGSFNPTLLASLPGKCTVLLNKFDLLPERITAEEVIQKVGALYQLDTRSLRPVSAKNRYGIPGLKSEIARFSKCAFWGYVNTGKSSLVNQILSDTRIAGEEPEQRATTSPFPGTTYEPVAYSLGDSFLIDIPGMANDAGVSRWLLENERHRIGKTKRLHRKTLFVRKNRTVFLSGLVRMDITVEKTAIIQCYFGDNIALHDTSLEKAEYIHESKIGDLLTPPYHPIPLKSIRWQEHCMRLDTGEDFSVNGIGWIHVAVGPIDIKVHFPEGTGMEKRKGFLQNSKVRKAFSR